MRRALSLLGGIGLGLALSQFPEYSQQYVQRLGGAVDELQGIVAEFDRAAAEGGLSRQEALVRFESAPDQFLAGRGTAMQHTIARHAELSAALAELQDASAWERLQHLPQLLDTEIGARTLENFRPAVPVTIEGFTYAFAGILGGYALVSLLIGLARLPFRRRTAYRV